MTDWQLLMTSRENNQLLSLNIRSLAKTTGPCSVVVHFITIKPHEHIVCSNIIITTAYAETLTKNIASTVKMIKNKITPNKCIFIAMVALYGAQNARCADTRG